MYSRRFVALMLSASLLGGYVRAHEAHSPAQDMTEAAQRWLASLDTDQREQAAFDLASDERRNWHFIPRERQGLSLGKMRPAQRHLALALLGTALSHRGLLKAATIMNLESVLAGLERGSGPVRDPELYFVSVFGPPSMQHPWGWRFEGHHLSLNFLVAGESGVSVTPSFFGANPAEVREGGQRGLRALAAEEDLARQLVQSLSGSQRTEAVLSPDAPRDILLDPSRRAELLEPKGLSVTAMTRAQATLLDQLVSEYLETYRAELANEDRAKIEKAGWDKLSFGWAGPLEPGAGHYYRVQGPTFVLEYDNTQNGANHIHAVWRDLSNDFGEDLLREHYANHPH